MDRYIYIFKAQLVGGGGGNYPKPGSYVAVPETSVLSSRSKPPRKEAALLFLLALPRQVMGNEDRRFPLGKMTN